MDVYMSIRVHNVREHTNAAGPTLVAVLMGRRERRGV